MLGRAAKLGVVVGAAGLAAVTARDTPAADVVVRLGRDVSAVASIIADYKLSLRGLAGDAREAAKAQCHERGAQRLLDLCFANGGVYIKLAQHVGQLDHLLPDAYVNTMQQHSLDRCPVTPWDVVSDTIQAELGGPPSALFRSFHPTPIASASLAQVHVAEALDGTKLAVKVQHAGLRESAPADIATIEALVTAVKFMFPAYDYTWLVEEVKANLPKELDFRLEAANASRCAQHLAQPQSSVRGHVSVPTVHPSLSSRRVLTMDFVEGVKVTDLGALRALGVRPADVTRLVLQAANDMIFLWGDVHCDPHAANLLVQNRGGRAHVVLLDHGLYREIDDAFRLEYAGLWRALITADEAGIQRHAAAMNAGELYPVFASMLTMRPWDAIIAPSADHLELSYSASAKERVMSDAHQYTEEISHLLATVPKELLLLLKTNDCLRSIDKGMGQPLGPLAPFTITARACERALLEGRWAVLERARLETRIAAMNLASAGRGALGRLLPSAHST